MQIKTRNNEKRPFDVREWNDEVKAFVRPLDGFETLVFNDYFFEFYNKERDAAARYNAGFNAALMCLVDENDAPLLTEEDRPTIEKASFMPLFRLFAQRLEDAAEPETAKKNF